MSAEVHRAVEDADDLKRLALNSEENDVPFVTGGAATFYQVLPQSIGFRAELDLLEFLPQTFQIKPLLLSSPSLEGVVGNGLEVENRRGREGELYYLALARFRNSFSVVTVVPSPRWSCS